MQVFKPKIIIHKGVMELPAKENIQDVLQRDSLESQFCGPASLTTISEIEKDSLATEEDSEDDSSLKQANTKICN